MVLEVPVQWTRNASGFKRGKVAQNVLHASPCRSSFVGLDVQVVSQSIPCSNYHTKLALNGPVDHD